MAIYADVLVAVNMIVDYFLLRLTAKLLHERPRAFRIIASSVLSGLGSLTIFLPETTLIFDFFSKMLIAAITVLVCFGFGNVKHFIKSTGVFFLVTCLYAGLLTALWQIFKPNGLTVSHGVVYYAVSPVILVVCTVAVYLLYLLFSRIFSAPFSSHNLLEMVLFAKGNRVGATAVADTGNALCDLFGKSEIIITDRSVAEALFGKLDCMTESELASRFRTVPCVTVSGTDLLDGLRCDKAEIRTKDKTILLENPIIAISKTKLQDGYSAILNPKILEKPGEVRHETETVVP